MDDFAIGRKAHRQEPSLPCSTMHRLEPSGAQLSKIAHACWALVFAPGTPCAIKEARDAFSAIRRETECPNNRVRLSNRCPSTAAALPRARSNGRPIGVDLSSPGTAYPMTREQHRGTG